MDCLLMVRGPGDEEVGIAAGLELQAGICLHKV